MRKKIWSIATALTLAVGCGWMKGRGNNDSKWIQLFAVQIFKEIEEIGLYQQNAGYNAGISECRSIIEVEYNRMVEKEDQMDLPEYGCLQDRFSHALKNPAHTNRESSYNAAILSCKSILKEVFKHKEDLLKYVISNGITFYYNDSIVLTEKLISTLEAFSKSPECEDEAYTLVEDNGHVYFY